MRVPTQPESILGRRLLTKLVPHGWPLGLKRSRFNETYLNYLFGYYLKGTFELQLVIGESPAYPGKSRKQRRTVQEPISPSISGSL